MSNSNLNKEKNLPIILACIFSMRSRKWARVLSPKRTQANKGSPFGISGSPSGDGTRKALPKPMRLAESKLFLAGRHRHRLGTCSRARAKVVPERSPFQRERSTMVDDRPTNRPGGCITYAEAARRSCPCAIYTRHGACISGPPHLNGINLHTCVSTSPRRAPDEFRRETSRKKSL